VVRVLRRGELTSGTHREAWDGLDRHGNRVSAGVYFVRLAQPTGRSTRRIVLLR